MQFNKVIHPVNCRFAAVRKGDRLEIPGREVRLRLDDLGDEIFRVELGGPTPWRERLCLNQMVHPERSAPSKYRLEVDEHATLKVSSADNKVLLAGRPGRTFGATGESWVLNFEHHADHRFWGCGEQWSGFEKSGQRFRMTNTDVWGDHPMAAVEKGQVSPLYLSVPWVIMRHGGTYVGILLDNPFPTFMSLGSSFSFMGAQPGDPPEENFFLGADGGKPIAYVIVGPTLRDVVEKFQRLVGTSPLPPLWALGHHQCRWGYASRKDLEEIDRQYRKHKIPCDALWLDIDYMDRYQVFTFDTKHWPSPAKDLASLRAKGRRIVAILDPGVKRRPGWAVYDAGMQARHFCRNTEGEPFVGFVWPGETVFPDFSQDKARAWWAGHAKTFFATGMDGAWLDMNDPSLGAVENDHCRFRDGTQPHAAFRNQYALGMAMATFDGFRAAHPDRRPFLLSRSGFTGQAKYSANWTGDNVANEAHLAASIPCSVNLSLSGIPFNGPDVPGFGGEPDDDLAGRWYKAGFLFPVLRNHSNRDNSPREPWRFHAKTLHTIRHFIRLRYKLLPYVYNLWMDQEEKGSPILRPLLYEFTPAKGQDFDRIGDQFLVGPALMQAPLLRKEDKARDVVLPPGSWYDAATGKWLAGGRTINVKDAPESTPLFVRGGTIIPMQPGEREDHENDLSQVELHCFLEPDTEAGARYRWDAGDGYAYKQGQRSGYVIKARSRDGVLEVDLSDVQANAGTGTVRIVAYGGEKKLRLRVSGVLKEIALKPTTWTIAGVPVKVGSAGPVKVG